ncbi:hypothetical protein TCA2_0657 [Paenibacillus sp. TCA20]|nr:hypothetical protein TCA2_0657 [Paenibacillus sp. TCA20]
MTRDTVEVATLARLAISLIVTAIAESPFNLRYSDVFIIHTPRHIKQCRRNKKIGKLKKWVAK